MDKREALRTIAAHAQAGRWDSALEECLGAAREHPEDGSLRTLLAAVADRTADRARPSAPAGAAPVPADGSGQRAPGEDPPRRRAAPKVGSDSMGELVQNSRRIADVLRDATTRHLDGDAEALVAAARSFLARNLLSEALGLCQKALTADPGHEQARALLVEISRRRGL